jgi:serine/threonine protein kinase/predicted Zn-dependent peptidase
MSHDEPELTTRIEADPRDADAHDDDLVPSGSFAAGLVDPEVTVGGVESRVLLARARQALLGWDRDPVTVGRYRILERIGSGGMGVVYSAHDDELDRQVAIKILRQDLAQGSAGRTRLLREAQATARLSHPNVVHVYEVGQESGQVFMAMELVRGDTLRMWQQAARRTWLETVVMFVAAGEGLAAAHAEGLVHRDFKPDNVLVGHDGRPRVLDFGLARVTSETLHGNDVTGRMAAVSSAGTSSSQLSASSGSHPGPGQSGSGSALQIADLTRTGTILGTPAYMAPEQLEHGEPSARSDQFSFCVALFEALYGRRPFVGSTYEELTDNIAKGAMVAVDLRRAKIPRAIHAALTKGLDRDPTARHHDMRELLTALRQGLSSRPPSSRTSWGVAGVLGATILGAAAYTLRVATPEPEATTEAPAIEPVPAPEPDPWAEIVAASDLPDPVSSPLPDDPMGVTVHRLRNGLTVYVAERPLEPQVSATFVVRAGGREEGEFGGGLASLTFEAMITGGEKLGGLAPALEAPSTTLAHRLLEALPNVEDVRARDALIKTAAAAEVAAARHGVPGEYFAALHRLGGQDPVTRMGDGISLTVGMPGHRLAAWAELTAELLRRPTFRQFVTAASRELGMYEMTSGQRAPHEMLRELASATGLHEDMAAAAARVSRVPLADVRAFHRNYYRPNNVALVLVGDVTPTQILPVIEQHFGDWEPAMLPTPPEIDRPLPAARKLIEVQEASTPLVMLGWPLPPAHTPEFAGFAALGMVLSGPKGLLAAEMRDRTAGGSAGLGPNRHFYASGAPMPGESLEDTERSILGVIESIAEDRVPDDVWPPLLAFAELERNRWARGSLQLNEQILDGFLDRRQWKDVARSAGATPITRADVVAAAKRLLARGYVAVFRRAGGRPWKVDVPTLPSAPRTAPDDAYSPMVQRLVDAPVTPLEPRFLVEGSHYRAAPYGGGRFISTAVDEPLVRMSWIYPIGVGEEPFACDVVRAKVDELPFGGFDVRPYCTADDTRIDIVGTADGFATHRDALLAWLEDAWPDADAFAAYSKRSIMQRRDLRGDAEIRAMTLHQWAIRGRAMIDSLLPADAAYQRATPQLAATIAQLRRFDPDVLYIGRDPEALRAALPTPKGIAAPVVRTPPTRTMTRTTVFLLDDPERDDVSAHVTMPWIATEPREHLAGMFHIEHTRMATWDDPMVGQWENPDYIARWSADPAYAIGLGLRAAPLHVVPAIERALTTLRSRPPADSFASALQRLEVKFRGARVPPRRVPDRVHAWPPGGTDPRVAQWMALPSLGYADLEAYWAKVDQTPVVISIVGDLDDLDRDALARLGDVVEVQVTDVVRDAWMTDVDAAVAMLFDE